MRRSTLLLEASLKFRHRPVTRKWSSKWRIEGRAFPSGKKFASSTSFTARNQREKEESGSDSRFAAASSKPMAGASGPRTAPAVVRYFDSRSPCRKSSLLSPANTPATITHLLSGERLCHRKRRSFSSRMNRKSGAFFGQHFQAIVFEAALRQRDKEV